MTYQRENKKKMKIEKKINKINNRNLIQNRFNKIR